MKQFQKVGLAAAVATVAAGTVAQPDSAVSRTETGDLAIIPYYTVLDGTNTGMHIINTTDSTQVVKVRLRRGTDSKDALDFNLVMSPRDEWTANIGPGGANGVLVTTNDTTCTVPAFPEGGAPMPDTWSEGATEGYVEVIAMAETATELEPIAVAAKHAAGTPADCAAVRQNFYRVAAADVGDASVRGTHASNLTSNAACASAGASTACGATGATNLSNFVDSDDNALKVSFMLTDPAGGLEAGDNAVMVEGFADAAMMTNQQPLSFGTDGVLNFDPLNFELPNLAYGAFASSNATRQAAGAAAGDSMTNGDMWNSLADALDADSIANDWAAFSTADGTVHADWVVTLPGQYVMTNPVCDTYESYSEATITAVAICNGVAAQTTAGIAAGLDVAEAAYSAAGGDDRNQLPLVVASNVDGGELVTGSNMNLWDREELSLAGDESEKPPEDEELGFSPGGSSGDPADPDITVTLPNEVNVIAFGDADSTTAVMSNLKLSVTPPSTSDRGWGRLDIESSNDAPMIWSLTGVDDGNVDAVVAGLDATGTSFTAVDDATDVAVVGFAVWQRSFAAQAGNYGRMIEHSTITSTSTSR
ncbi:hypothetical protein N8739_06070 [Luminiphilus sp.]|nr:hypothetical protein [Luminiphilus sp.]